MCRHFLGIHLNFITQQFQLELFILKRKVLLSYCQARYCVYLQWKHKNKRTQNFSIDENRIKHSENLLFTELFHLDPVEHKRVEVSFTAPDLSSHGGLLLLGGLDQRLGLIDRLTGCLEDNRRHRKKTRFIYEFIYCGRGSVKCSRYFFGWLSC